MGGDAPSERAARRENMLSSTVGLRNGGRLSSGDETGCRRDDGNLCGDVDRNPVPMRGISSCTQQRGGRCVASSL